MATNIQKRNQDGNQTQDPASIANFEYNQAAGAQKTTEVGRHLLPLPTPGVGVGYTTVVNGAPYALPGAGRNVAVFNSTATTGTITFGSTSAVTSLAAGIADASGNVGLPCPQGWSYFASGYSNWIISSAATLFVFLINDNTSIQVQAPGIQNNYGFPGTQP
jgi:hypothetical protein